MTATITVTIWHNVTRDPDGRPTGYFGFRPGDQMVRVFTYQIPADGRPPEQAAEDAFAICNGHPRDAAAAELSRLYYRRELRSLSRGDCVAVGEVALVCERAGWAPMRGGITEVRADQHGTHPLPGPATRQQRGGREIPDSRPGATDDPAGARGRRDGQAPR